MLSPAEKTFLSGGSVKTVMSGKRFHWYFSGYRYRPAAVVRIGNESGAGKGDKDSGGNGLSIVTRLICGRRSPGSLRGFRQLHGLRNVGIDADGRRLLFYCINYCFECLRLVHCQIGQNLAVEDDALGVEFADKLRIGHSLRADGCVDTHDPQAAECSLLELAVCVSLLQTLLDRVFGYGPYVSP